MASFLTAMRRDHRGCARDTLSRTCTVHGGWEGKRGGRGTQDGHECQELPYVDSEADEEIQERLRQRLWEADCAVEVPAVLAQRVLEPHLQFPLRDLHAPRLPKP